MLRLPPASAGLRPSRRAELRVLPAVGLPDFAVIPDAARRFAAVAGLVVEEAPRGDCRHQLTKACMLFLARWAPSSATPAGTKCVSLSSQGQQAGAV